MVSFSPSRRNIEYRTFRSEDRISIRRIVRLPRSMSPMKTGGLVLMQRIAVHGVFAVACGSSWLRRCHRLQSLGAVLLPFLIGVGQKVLSQLVARTLRATSGVAGLTRFKQPRLLFHACTYSFERPLLSPFHCATPARSLRPALDQCHRP